MGFLSTLVAGASITAYQAMTVSKDEQTGKIKTGDFVRNFKDLAVMNSRMVVDTVKSKVGGGAGEYRYSDKGENGYAYKNAESENNKVSEVFETIREYAPGVIDKVEEFVDDVRENAPEYKAKAQGFVDDVKDAAIKALELAEKDEKDEKAEEPKPEKKAEKAEKAEEPKQEKKSVKAKKTVKEDKEEK